MAGVFGFDVFVPFEDSLFFLFLSLVPSFSLCDDYAFSCLFVCLFVLFCFVFSPAGEK